MRTVIILAALLAGCSQTQAHESAPPQQTEEVQPSATALEEAAHSDDDCDSIEVIGPRLKSQGYTIVTSADTPDAIRSRYTNAQGHSVLVETGGMESCIISKR